MNVRLKQLPAQVIVITGASSGIGLATARMAARKGARLVLAARSGDALSQLCDDLNRGSFQATSVAADVGKEQDVRRIADHAIETFGGIDTWINDAGISIFGKLEEIATEDHRRLFETNFWGVVYGSLEAAKHLRQRGGALINVGSVVSERAIPLQGMYSASKHAVKGFTDALRMELEKEGAPVSVTLIEPTSIDTPFTKHAKNYMEVEPTLPPPVYAPEVVADAILHAAVVPTRVLEVGGGGKMITGGGRWAPRLTDRYMEAMVFDQQRTNRPSRGRELDSLHSPRTDGESYYLRESGDYEGHVMKSSLYTKSVMHPVVTGAILTGIALTALATLGGRE